MLFFPLPLALCGMLTAACTDKDGQTVVLTPQVVPTELYVAPDGLDSNPGTRNSPLRSLARAAQVVTPGTIVNVLPGTYHGGIRTTVDGHANARIVFRSVERWRARIVPPPVSSSTMAWDNRASHVDIEGFDIDGRLDAGVPEASTGLRWLVGIYSGGSYDRIVGNHVHDVATTVPCTAAGGAGIGIDSYYKGKHADVIGNSVHDVGPAGCRWIQGINMNTPGAVRSNVVYRIAEAGIHLWHDAHDVIVANNTVTASNTGIIVGGGDFYYTQGPNDHTQVFNNIVFDNHYGISEQGATGPHNSYRNNLVFGNPDGDWRLADGMGHSGTVSAAPAFLDYARTGTPDFRLAAHSPAIGKGAPDAAAGADFLGHARARADRIDLGAYQE